MSVKKITVTALETALKDIMRQTPFEKITVSDITNRCQLNRQTFYYHFADKYALLGQIYKQEIFDPFTDGLTFENWNTHLLQMFETMAADAALYKNAVLHADDEFRRFLFQSAATLFRDAVAKLNLRSGLQVSEEEQHFIADFLPTALQARCWIGCAAECARPRTSWRRSCVTWLPIAKRWR